MKPASLLDVPNLPNLPNLFSNSMRARAYMCMHAGERAHTLTRSRAHYGLETRLGRLGRLGTTSSGKGFELPNMFPTSVFVKEVGNMEGLVIRLRALVRRVIPILRADGWDEADLRAISPAIKAAVASQDEPQLRGLCAWLSGKLPAHHPGQGAVPVLSFEAEKRLADLWWKREQEGKA
jgi:hypothetical protein